MAGVVLADGRERSWTVDETERLSREWMPFAVGPSSVDSSSSPSIEGLLPVSGSVDAGYGIGNRDIQRQPITIRGLLTRRGAGGAGGEWATCSTALAEPEMKAGWLVLIYEAWISIRLCA